MHPQGANTMVTSGLISRSNLVGTGRAISVLFCIGGVRNKQSHLHFRRSRPIFRYGRLAFLERLIEVFANWWVWSESYLLRMTEITSGSSFEPNNPTEQRLGYV